MVYVEIELHMKMYLNKQESRHGVSYSKREFFCINDSNKVELNVQLVSSFIQV